MKRAILIALLAGSLRAEATVEICDFTDNDSDGFTDEGCGLDCGIWTGPRAVGCGVMTPALGTNVASGEARFGPVTDFRIRVPNERIELARTWSSGLARHHRLTSYQKPLGVGWSHTFMESMISLGTRGASDVTMWRGDGAPEKFTYMGGSPPAWDPPKGHFRKLEYSAGPPSRYWLTKEDGTRWEYEAIDAASGRLVQITDPAGAVTQVLHYPDGGTGCTDTNFSGNICRIVYPSGRVLNFLYVTSTTGVRLDKVRRDDIASTLVQFEYNVYNVNGIDYHHLGAAFHGSTWVTYNYSSVEIQPSPAINVYYLYEALDETSILDRRFTWGASTAKVTIAESPRRKIEMTYDSGETTVEDKFRLNEWKVQFSGETPTGQAKVALPKNFTDYTGPKTLSWTGLNLDWTQDQKNVYTTYLHDSKGRATRRIDNDTDNDASTLPAPGPGWHQVDNTWHPNVERLTSRTVPAVLGSGNAVVIYDYQDPNGSPPPPDPFCGTSACDGPEDYNTVNVTPLLRRVIRKGNTATDLLGTTGVVTYVTTNTWESGRLVQIDGPRTDVQDLTAFVYWDNTATLFNRGRLRYLRRHRDAINYLQTAYDLYQLFGMPGQVVDENSRTWSFSEDARGLLDGFTSPLGNATDYARDGAERMDYVLMPKGNVLDHEYDWNGFRTRLWRRPSASSGLCNWFDQRWFVYGANKLLGQESGIRLASCQCVNPPDCTIWNPISETSEQSKYRYDGLGRLERRQKFRDSTSTASHEYWSKFDEVGREIEAADENNAVVDAGDNNTRTNFRSTFDNLGRVTQSERKVSGVWQVVATYAYNKNDQLATVTDSQGYATTYIYDDFGRAVRMDTVDSGAMRYTFDAAGNMTGRKSAAGTTTTYTFDALNRKTLDNYSGSTDQTYTYDSASTTTTNCRTGTTVSFNNQQGRLAKVVDDAGTTYFSYDNDGRLDKEAYKSSYADTTCLRVSEWTYDANGNVAAVRYPTGRLVTNVFPAYPGDVDRPSSVTVSYGGGTTTIASNIGYHAGGRLRTFDYGNGLTASFTQWLDRSPRELATYNGADYWLRFLVDLADLDGVGNIKKIQDEANSRLDQTFAYDDMYRLDLAAVADSTAGAAYASQDYAYTGVTEKRASIIRDGAAQQNYTYVSGNNRLSSAEGTSYSYTSDGNVSWMGSQPLSYDNEQRLTLTNSWTSRYDFRNLKRHLRECPSGCNYNVFYYGPSGERIAHLGVFPSGSYPRPLKEYIHLGGRRIAAVDATMTSASAVTDNSLDYVHGNHLDAPVAVTNSNKTAIWKAQYDPFGQVAFNTEKRTISYSTPHPYGDLPGCYGYAACLKWDSGAIRWPGAARVRVKFSGFQTELNYDQARIYDKDGEQIHTYHGAPNPNTFWSEWVEGDTIQVKLWVDVSVNYYGFDLVELEAEFRPPHSFQIPSVTQMSHPYPNSGCSGQACAVVWDSGAITYTGATRLRAKLDQFHTQPYYDQARVYDAADAQVYSYESKLGGTAGSIWTGWVTGSTIRVRLWANSTTNYYGFDLTEVEADYGKTYTLHPRLPGQWNEPETNLVYNWHRHYSPAIGRYLAFDRWSADTPYAYAVNRPMVNSDVRGQSPAGGYDVECNEEGEDCQRVAVPNEVPVPVPLAAAQGSGSTSSLLSTKSCTPDETAQLSAAMSLLLSKWPSIKAQYSRLSPADARSDAIIGCVEGKLNSRNVVVECPTLRENALFGLTLAFMWCGFGGGGGPVAGEVQICTTVRTDLDCTLLEEIAHTCGSGPHGPARSSTVLEWFFGGLLGRFNASEIECTDVARQLNLICGGGGDRSGRPASDCSFKPSSCPSGKCGAAQ